MREVPTFTAGDFHKATASSPNGNCVRVARRHGWTAVWDDKQATVDTTAGTLLSTSELILLTDQQFDCYQNAVRNGRFRGPLSLMRRPDGRYTMRAVGPPTTPGVALVFDTTELAAFHHGIRHHEFDHHDVNCARRAETR